MATVLSDVVIKRIKADPTKAIEVPDGGCVGLYLVVQKSGEKSWAFRYRFHGKNRKWTIGKYPSPYTLTKAHAEAAKARDLIAGGGDPAGEKARTRHRAATGEGSFESVVREFLTEYAKPKNKTWGDTASTFGLKPEKKGSSDPAKFIVVKDSLVDRFKHRPVESITRDEIRAEIKRIAKGTAIAGNRTLAAVRKFYNWCIAEGHATSNPCDKMPKPQKEVSRERWLKSDDEFRAVWLATGELGWPFGPIYQLLILTGQRREEVAGMRWKELDVAMKTWTIPKERAKNGVEHTLPLSAPALAIIEKLHRVGRSEFVFTRTGKTPVSGWSSAKRRLDAKALAHLRKIVEDRGGSVRDVEIEEWRTHDLRRTLASRMGDIDVMPHVVEVILNHKSGHRAGVAAVYNRNTYQRPMRAALDAWAVEVARLAGEPSAPSNVVPIAGRVA